MKEPLLPVPSAANTRPSKTPGPWVRGKILTNIDEIGTETRRILYIFLNLEVTKRSQYALGSYAPVFAIRSIFTPLGPTKKHNLPKVIAKVRGFFSATDNKTKEKICIQRVIFEFRRLLVMNLQTKR